MKQSWNTSLRWACGALALMGASLVSAQTAATPIAAPTPAAVTAAQDAAPVHPAKKHHHAKPKHQHKHKQKHQSGHKYASPQQHEAAAVAAERRRGVGPGHHQRGDAIDEYQRNALKRCDVFKVQDDRRACVERVRQPQISGSVEGGGLIREYTQTVPVHPHPVGHAPLPVYNGPPRVKPAH